MKTFEEVKSMMGTFKDCLMTTERFLEYWEDGTLTSYDGVGEIHNGDIFVTDGFETDIFDFIREESLDKTKEEFIQKYPYVAWYNK